MTDSTSNEDAPTDDHPSAEPAADEPSTEDRPSSEPTSNDGSDDRDPAGPVTTDPDDAASSPTQRARTASDTAPPGENRSGATPPDESESGAGERDVRKWLLWAGIGVAGLFALISLFGFYNNGQQAIQTFVAEDFQSVFLAGFNLLILLAAGIAISLLVRRLAAEPDDVGN